MRLSRRRSPSATQMMLLSIPQRLEDVGARELGDRCALVPLCPDGFGHRRPAAADTSAGLPRLLAERQAPNRRRAVFLDARLALRAAAARSHDEPGGFAEVLDHLVVAARIAQRPPILFVAGRLE